MAHCFIAACLARVGAAKTATALLSIWMAKEIAFDLSAARWAWPVLLDTLADIAMAFSAFVAFRVR